MNAMGIILLTLSIWVIRTIIVKYKNPMNPIKVILLTLSVWIIGTIILCYLFTRGGDSFIALVYSFYLTPFVCMAAFIISAFFFRSWVRDYKIIAIIISALLIAWGLSIVLYIQSLIN